MSGRLIADREQIAAFVQALFKHAPTGTFISLRTFFDKGEELEGLPCRPLWVPVDSENLIERATAGAQWCADHPKRVVFAPPIATFRTPARASADNLAAVLVLSVEIDHAPPEALTTLIPLLGKPTLLVVSGGIDIDYETGETHDRLHLHWRLARPAITEAAIARAVLARRLACALVGGDASGTNPVHPFRWPGSWHRKAEPRLSFILELNDVEVDLDHAYDVLLEAADQRGMVEYDDGTPPTSNPEKMARSIEDVATWLRHIPNPLPESTQPAFEWWNHVGMALYAATGGSAEGRDLFLEWSRKDPAYDTPYHHAQVTRRWSHYHRNPPTRLGAGTLYYLYNEYWSDSGDSAGDGDVIDGGLT